MSVAFSLDSSNSSSLNVGLKGFVRPRPGVPGTFMALFNGDFGAMATDSLFAPFPMYPNPTSPGWAFEVSVFSENGSLCGSMGEWTVVASAKRGVLGGLANDDDVDVESEVETELADMVRTGVRFRASGRFFSSRPMAGEDGDVDDAAFLCYVV